MAPACHRFLQIPPMLVHGPARLRFCPNHPRLAKFERKALASAVFHDPWLTAMDKLPRLTDAEPFVAASPSAQIIGGPRVQNTVNLAQPHHASRHDHA